MTAIATSLCALSIVAISATLIVRSLPIFALDWAGADRVEISDLGEKWKVVLSDPREIAILMKYGESGHYETMLMSGLNIHIYVTKGNVTTGYYLHGTSIGPLPGGMVQTVFVPQRDGLSRDLRGILARYGHAELVP